MKKAAVLATSLVAASCSSTHPVGPETESLFAAAIPICAVLANPTPFVDKRVAVSGLYFVSPKGGVFFDRNCERGELSLDRNEQSADLDDKRAIANLRAAWRIRGDAPVVIAGVLKDHSPSLSCSNSFCSRYTLEMASIVAARPTTAQSR